MYILRMAVMTLSEARAALPDVLTRVAQGEEITITRHGRPVAVVVRPDTLWRQPPAEAVAGETELVRLVQERARRHGRSLEEEFRTLLEAAETGAAAVTPINLATVRTDGSSSWSREEIYGDEGR
jgi:antitoxin (DNA-binding transcriptional repressor) of toxin-antitoxin stability system